MGFTAVFGSTTLPNVRSVARGAEVSLEAWVNTTDSPGLKKREFTVQGIIFNVNRIPIRGPEAQEAVLTTYGTLEAALIAEGSATLTLNSGITISGCRVQAVNIDELSNNPALFYTVTFVADNVNPFAETVTLTDDDGTTTFDPIPQVTDEWIRQDGTIDWTTQVITSAKKITISGVFQGTVAQLSDIEDEIKERCTTYATQTLVIPSGSYTVLCAEFSFETPAETDSETVKKYTLEFITEKNYSIESENLPHTLATWGGISLDITNGYNSTIQRINDAGTYRIESETLSISGEKHYSSFAAAEAGRVTIATTANITPNTHSSFSGKALVVTGATVSEVQREGRSTAGAQKYIIQVSLNMAWVPPEGDACVGTDENIFGVNFLCVSSKNYGGTLDPCGLKTQDTLSVSGITVSLPGIEIGSQHTVSGKTYWVTSLNIGSKDPNGRYQVSASGRTIDTVDQAREFIQVFLPSGGFFDEMTSRSKSASYKYSINDAGYKVTSVTMNIAGNKFVGSGTADSFLDLLDHLTQQKGIDKLELRVTSVNIGKKEPFVDHVGCTLGFKQSVSIAYTMNFEVGGSSGSQQGGEDTQIIEDESVEIKQITNKYTQIQIPGGSLNFKKTGLNPGSVKITTTRRRVGGNATIFFGYPDPHGAPIAEEFFSTNDMLSATSTTRKRVQEWTVIKGTIGSITPGTGTIILTIPAS